MLKKIVFDALNQGVPKLQHKLEPPKFIASKPIFPSIFRVWLFYSPKCCKCLDLRNAAHQSDSVEKLVLNEKIPKFHCCIVGTLLINWALQNCIIVHTELFPDKMDTSLAYKIPCLFKTDHIQILTKLQSYRNKKTSIFLI